ncbi:MYND-type domain-containing protein [Mycena indigotica]|uniref:MYND-type domain-containing protein n=1 Tax=Mycena indigotica TaxID=2126181 RepID=A0A8H6WHC9_9AGAR|nr:MYND-type domain-containing protein [Mycena indigotica]KAF7314943.1 MYND-type domain-containing protein [Mycena indigotica]
MHPCLDISNIQRLPAGIRRYAEAAVQDSFKFESMLALTLRYDKLPDAQRLLVLPVLYHALDECNIPTSLDLAETQRHALKRQIFVVLKCFQGMGTSIARGVAPKDATPEIWPRILAWVLFLDGLWEQIPAFYVDGGQEVVLLRVLGIIAEYADPAFFQDLLDKSELFVLVGSLWRRLTFKQYSDSLTRGEAPFPYLSDLLVVIPLERIRDIANARVNVDLVIHKTFESILAGAGTLSTLAEMLVISISRTATEPHLYLRGQNQRSCLSEPIPDVITMIGALYVFGHLMCFGNSIEPSFAHHLLAAGVIPALVAAIRAEAFEPDAGVPTDTTFDHSTLPVLRRWRLLGPSWVFIFLSKLITEPGLDHRWMIVEALDAGLLHSLICLCVNTKLMQDASAVSTSIINENDVLGPGCFSDHTDKVKRLLGLTLPAYSFYYSVLAALRDAFIDVYALRSDLDEYLSQIFDPELLHVWHLLRHHVNQLFTIAEYKSSDSAVTRFRACDNLACNKLLPRTQLKQCSQCLDTLYCGLACQRADWRSSHRERCKLLAPRNLEYRHLFIRPDLSFFRALMTCSFSQYRYSLSLSLARFRQMHGTPFHEIYIHFTFLNVTERPQLKIVDLASDEATRIRELFTDVIDRVRESEGRMQLHVLDVACGPQDEDDSDSNGDPQDHDNRISMPMPLRFASNQYFSRLNHLVECNVVQPMVEPLYFAEIQRITDEMGGWVY